VVHPPDYGTEGRGSVLDRKDKEGNRGTHHGSHRAVNHLGHNHSKDKNHDDSANFHLNWTQQPQGMHLDDDPLRLIRS